MANLLNQNIGTNYKGILNLNTLNGNLSGTLQAVTDGDGNASPLTLSTGEVGISRTIALSAGSSNVRLINETYTINNSGAQTGTATGIFLNATETALNGMGHNLLDLQRGGVSQFLVAREGSLTTTGRIVAINSSLSRFLSIGLGSNFQTNFSSTTDGVLLLTDGGGSSFGRLQFGGTTNAFPAIKRNGGSIDIVTADDGGPTNLNAREITSRHPSNASAGFLAIDGANKRALLTGSGGTNAYPSVGSVTANDFGILVNSNHAARFTQNLSLIIGGAFNVAEQTTAILQLESTTKGFLPPRMTTTQVNAISSPAAGLVVYSTTENALCLYNGSSWRKLNDSPL
jgi:hypothetical protein